MSGLPTLPEPFHRPFQTADGRLQSGYHLLQLADGVIDLAGIGGVEVAAAVTGNGVLLASQPVDLLSQASSTDMEGPFQLRSAGAVCFSETGTFEICQNFFVLHCDFLSGAVLPEEGTMRKKEGAAFPLREYGP